MKKFLKIAGGIVGLLIVGLILLVMFTPSESVEKVGEVSSDKTVEASAPKAEDKVYKVGDVVSVNGFEVTITKAEFTEPAEYSEPSNGKVLTLTIDAVNNTNDKQMIDNTEFNLYDPEGNALEQYYGYDDVALSGTVNKGKKISGKVYYDVVDSKAFELIYTPSFSFSGDTDITFNLEVGAAQ